MKTTLEFKEKTKSLIDDLKSVCANYGLGNDGNEFKIITQVFLYKFLNDKFIYEATELKEDLKKAENPEEKLSNLSDDEYEMLTMELGANTAILKPRHFISYLYEKQNEANFSELFDSTLLDIAKINSEIFSVVTEGGEKIVLFDELSQYVTGKKDEFCRAIINKLVGFSFENIFQEKFDFYATIFEYLIKDYNSNSGGKYAEYFTPHAVSKIMAKCLVHEDVNNVTCYDPSAGSGTLLMNLAHEIGENKCTIYSQDISQKSSHLLRLNLILNNLVHSIPNIIKGNTILEPYHAGRDGRLQKFDYIVSNPPFKLDFSDYRDELDSKINKERFFAGIPKIPKKAKDKMAIYELFIQHIMYSMKDTGKAAVVVPTGFITALSGIDKKIRQKLVDDKMLEGVVSMPSNIFASTGTNVSVLFLNNQNSEDVILIDASSLGETIKEGKNQKTVLTADEEDQIISAFREKKSVEEFSISVSYNDIKEKHYSLSAGQYFDVKIEYSDISAEDFNNKINTLNSDLEKLFNTSRELESEILEGLGSLKHG